MKQEYQVVEPNDGDVRSYRKKRDAIKDLMNENTPIGSVLWKTNWQMYNGEPTRFDDIFIMEKIGEKKIGKE